MSESRLRDSVVLRALVAAILILVLYIPIINISFTLDDRREWAMKASSEFAASWGGAQTIAGPILSIPFVDGRSAEPGKNEQPKEQIIHLIPDSLTVSGNLTTEMKRKGMYRTALYRTPLVLTGSIDMKRIRSLETTGKRLLLDGTRLAVRVADLKGIAGAVNMTVNGRPIAPLIDEKRDDAKASAILFNPQLDPAADKLSFRCEIDLKGSSDLRVVPTGRMTAVDLRSAWPTPEYIGSAFPDSHTEGEHGFSAQWTISPLNNPLPSQWTESPEFSGTEVGVKIAPLITDYRMVERTIRYAFLTLFLTFTAFLLTEVLSRELFHPVHYSLVGFCLVLFYLLVLSLSEVTGFVVAYWIAVAATVSAIFFYTRTIAWRGFTPYLIAGGIGGLDAFLFILFQAEDYALLAGSSALFLMLLGVMFLTRKVDWYALRGSTPGEAR